MANFHMQRKCWQISQNKVAYSIKHSLQSESFESISTFLKCFDAMIKPILLYGCEVWGIEEIILQSKKMI